MITLKLPERSLGISIEIAARIQAELLLYLFDKITSGTASKRRASSRICRRYHGLERRGTRHNQRHLQAKIVHVEGWVGLAADGQCVLFVAAAHDCICFDLFEDRCNTSTIGIHLDCWPRIGLRTAGQTGVLGLNPDEVRVACRKALPIATAGMVAPAGGNDKKRPIATKTKLCERAREIRSSIGHYSEAWHIPGKRSGSVMTYDAFDRPDVTAPTALPPWLYCDFQSGVE
jgi:hypothetical protein